MADSDIWLTLERETNRLREENERMRNYLRELAVQHAMQLNSLRRLLGFLPVDLSDLATHPAARRGLGGAERRHVSEGEDARARYAEGLNEASYREGE